MLFLPLFNANLNLQSSLFVSYTIQMPCFFAATKRVHFIDKKEFTVVTPPNKNLFFTLKYFKNIGLGSVGYQSFASKFATAIANKNGRRVQKILAPMQSIVIFFLSLALYKPKSFKITCLGLADHQVFSSKFSIVVINYVYYHIVVWINLCQYKIS